MAVNNTRDARTYHTPGVVNGNLARDLRTYELEQQLEQSGRIEFDKRYRQKQESVADELSRRRQANRATVRQAQSVPIAALFCGMIVAALAVMVVFCHVQINEISGNIVSMKQQIEQLEMEQIALRTEYEQAFDTNSVKEAAEAAGMYQPGEGQIYYINLPGEDQAIACAQQEKGGFKQFLTTINQHIYTALEYFR